VLGPGTILSTLNTSGSVLYILAQGDVNISGEVLLNNTLAVGDRTDIFTQDNNSISSAGVSNGGATTSGGSQSNGFGGGGKGATVLYLPYVAGYGGNGRNGGDTPGEGGAGAPFSYQSVAQGNNGETGTPDSSGGGGGSVTGYRYLDTYATARAKGGSGATAYGHNGSDGLVQYQTTGEPNHLKGIGGGGGGAGSSLLIIPNETNETKEPLFDIEIKLKDMNLTEEQALILYIDLINKNPFEEIDVKIEYHIYDLDNNELFYSSETKAIYDILSFKKVFPEIELTPGEYIIKVEIIYNENQNHAIKKNKPDRTAP